ncbi:MAG: hypothetical protein ACI4MK_10605 [Aristaeellaceae bacterium]
MNILPANSGEPLDQEQVAQYIRHLWELYDAKQTEAYRELLIPEEQPCTFSLTRLAGLPWDFEKPGPNRPAGS